MFGNQEKYQKNEILSPTSSLRNSRENDDYSALFAYSMSKPLDEIHRDIIIFLKEIFFSSHAETKFFQERAIISLALYKAMHPELDFSLLQHYCEVANEESEEKRTEVKLWSDNFDQNSQSTFESNDIKLNFVEKTLNSFYEKLFSAFNLLKDTDFCQPNIQSIYQKNNWFQKTFFDNSKEKFLSDYGVMFPDFEGVIGQTNYRVYPFQADWPAQKKLAYVMQVICLPEEGFNVILFAIHGFNYASVFELLNYLTQNNKQFYTTSISNIQSTFKDRVSESELKKITDALSKKLDTIVQNLQQRKDELEEKQVFVLNGVRKYSITQESQESSVNHQLSKDGFQKFLANMEQSTNGILAKEMQMGMDLSNGARLYSPDTMSKAARLQTLIELVSATDEEQNSYLYQQLVKSNNLNSLNLLKIDLERYRQDLGNLSFITEDKISDCLERIQHYISKTDIILEDIKNSKDTIKQFFFMQLNTQIDIYEKRFSLTGTAESIVRSWRNSRNFSTDENTSGGVTEKKEKVQLMRDALVRARHCQSLNLMEIFHYQHEGKKSLHDIFSISRDPIFNGATQSGTLGPALDLIKRMQESMDKKLVELANFHQQQVLRSQPVQHFIKQSP